MTHLSISVIPLREQPSLCDFFAAHFEAEWPDWYGPQGRGNAKADLESYANREGHLPVGVVALDQAMSPLGIAALRATSIDSHTHLHPWATAGFVVPSERRKGIGAALLARLMLEAARLGYPSVFCATATAVSLLVREGWMKIETVLHDGEVLTVFEKSTNSPPRIHAGSE